MQVKRFSAAVLLFALVQAAGPRIALEARQSKPAPSTAQQTFTLQEALSIARPLELLILGVEFTNTTPKGEGQCRPQVGRQQFAVMGNWIPELALATNNLPGGCGFRFTILDPTQKYGTVELISVLKNKENDGASDACYPNISPTVPVTLDVPKWTPTLVIDTLEGRPNTCMLGFRLSGQSSRYVQFEAYATAKGPTDHQCGPSTSTNNPYQIYPNAPNGGHALDLYLRTQQNTGSCAIGFRLVRLTADAADFN